MTAPDSGRWWRASPHLDRALDLSPGDREIWLAELRVEDAELAAYVGALLEVHRALDAEGFLEQRPLVPTDGALTRR
jgi:hypothetical protein